MAAVLYAYLFLLQISMNPDTALRNVSKSQFSHLYNRKDNTCPADSGVYGLSFVVNTSLNCSLLNTCEER